MTKPGRKIKWIAVLSLLLFVTAAIGQQKDLSVLVVRGGHQYDTPEFEQMCRSLDDVDVDLVLTAHMQAMKPEALAEEYDAILFLNQNKHYPEYASNKKKMMELTNLGVGMVFLHFTLSSYPQWDEFHDLVGGKWYLKKFTEDKSLHSTYKTKLTLDVKILDPDHPVSEGLENFSLTDTYYGNITTSPSIKPLLGVDHPEISESIAWTHKYNNSKVVYIMPGYSKEAYENPSYKKLISNSLKYVSSKKEKDKQLPNILWIVTDDQRADALECYNMATRGQKESPLGYVSSPNINKLASEGALFVNAFCNSPACGPSRGSMLSGRYTFRNGHYAFELSHQNPDFIEPSFPQLLQKEGYVTTVFGKGDAYIYKWGPGQGFNDAGHYNYKMHFKHNLQRNNVGDFWNQPVFSGKAGKEERVLYPDGRLVQYYIAVDEGEVSKEDIKKKKQLEKEFDILRSYTRSNTSLIIGGENPQPAGKTVDGMIVKELKLFLENQETEFVTSWGERVPGADPGKPLLVNLGFHLPHTPVLPPKEYRDIFKKQKYKVPEFDEKELDKMPPQMVQLHEKLNMSNMTAKEKQQAIQDYYAFCAYGDALIGEAVEAFKEYCKKNQQEYVIVYTVGDHGWHLGEQGIEAKFGPWKQSVHGALIVVASDKTKVPEGLIQEQLVEYVDVTPTILSECGVDIENEKYDYLDGFSLMDFIGNDKEKREYIVGEINLVAGPRAYMRSRDYAFSMRTRPVNNAKLNENIRWALDCPLEDAELALYDLRTDPLERNNLAADADYAELAQWFREKLGKIVLGDGRIECDWSKPNTYALSTFALGANDKKLDIPAEIIPAK